MLKKFGFGSQVMTNHHDHFEPQPDAECDMQRAKDAIVIPVIVVNPPRMHATQHDELW